MALRSSSSTRLLVSRALYRSYHGTVVARGGMTPPMAPFARSPARFEKVRQQRRPGGRPQQVDDVLDTA